MRCHFFPTPAEIVKRRVKGLHQHTSLGSLDILEGKLTEVDADEADKPGMRHVSIINITLSSEPLDESLPGYQAPLPDNMVQPRPAYTGTRTYRGGYRGSFRGRGRGGYQQQQYDNYN